MAGICMLFSQEIHLLELMVQMGADNSTSSPAAGESAMGYQYPQHHPKVGFNKDALPYGSAVYAHVHALAG